MENYLNFGTCLTDLLNITNIKNIQLANAINVDPSLISKWKTGKRKISPKSNYLKTISKYLSSNVTNEHQKKNIQNIAFKFNFCIDNEKYNDLNNYIYTLLLLSLQGYKKISSENSGSYSIYNSTEEINTSRFGSINSFELIKGEENIVNAGIDLLKSIPIKPYYVDESILITFYTEFNFFSNYGQSYSQWCDTLLEVQRKGWSITKLISIDNNKERNLKIMTEILNNISSKNYLPYFINKYDILMHYREIIFIPDTGVLICFFNPKSGKIDNAFLLKNSESLVVFKDTFSLTSSHLTSLITNKADITEKNYLTNLIYYEKSNGNRYAYNSCINLLSTSLELYNKLSSNHNKSTKNKELTTKEERNNFKKIFTNQIETYKFIDIYSKDFIENLVKKSKEPSASLNSHDIYYILKNIIYMLEKYENYNIALINENKPNIFNNFSWIIKDSNSILVDNFYQNIKNSEKVSITITEPTIVDYITNCFIETLEEIAPINKEKKRVIAWFETQIQYLNC